MRRRYVGVLLCLLLGSIGILIAFSATWVVVQVPVFAGDDTGSTFAREVSLTGRDLVPLGAAMGWVGLAAIAAILATRTWGRRATGAAVLLAGGVAGVTGVAFALAEVASGGTGAFVEAALRARSDAVPSTASVSAWWVLATLSGLALMASGLLTLLEGPSWPRLGSRYARQPGGSAEPPLSGSAGDAMPSAAATWDALDRGEDPTAPGGPDRGGPGE